MISTLHARTALHSFQRLAGLGVEPSDIRDNLVGVFAQRLLRKKCCAGCPLCISNGGYLGRIMVAEWIEMCGPLLEMLDGRIGISDCKLVVSVLWGVVMFYVRFLTVGSWGVMVWLIVTTVWGTLLSAYVFADRLTCSSNYTYAY